MRILAWAAVVALGAGQVPPPRTFVVDFSKEAGKTLPRTGFLGGLRDGIPDAVIEPLHPALWRIGHQFRGRIAGGLQAAVDRVEKLGARYKLVMSDLIKSDHDDWPRYEADVKKLVGEVGGRAGRIIWEPVNEPDCSHKPIQKYYDLYAHAFKALREADPKLEICGPGFAFPSHDKYRQFLDFCRDAKVECTYLAWHYTGWDADAPERQKWDLGKLPDLVKLYPAQKVREIHCDEWGAGPQKPGRLHPGRAVVWFHYLENVYKVDRACRANWGKEDDYLGGIVDEKGEPHPVYHAYRLYAELRQRPRVPCEGSDAAMACLAGGGPDRREALVGSIAKGPQAVQVVLKGLGIAPGRPEVRLIPVDDLGGTMKEDGLLKLSEKDFEVKPEAGGLRLTLPKVEENQVYQIRLPAR
jgi:hypothetical protein